MKRSTKLTIWSVVFLLAALFAVPEDGTDYAPFLGVLGSLILATIGIAFALLSSAAHQKELDREEARVHAQMAHYAAIDAELTAQMYRADQNLERYEQTANQRVADGNI